MFFYYWSLDTSTRICSSYLHPLPRSKTTVTKHQPFLIPKTKSLSHVFEEVEIKVKIRRPSAFLQTLHSPASHFHPEQWTYKLYLIFSFIWIQFQAPTKPACSDKTMNNRKYLKRHTIQFKGFTKSAFALKILSLHLIMSNSHQVSLLHQLLNFIAPQVCPQ